MGEFKSTVILPRPVPDALVQVTVQETLELVVWIVTAWVASAVLIRLAVAESIVISFGSINHVPLCPALILPARFNVPPEVSIYPAVPLVVSLWLAFRMLLASTVVTIENGNVPC